MKRSLLLGTLLCISCAQAPSSHKYETSPQWKNKRFENTDPIQPSSFWHSLWLGMIFIFDKPSGSSPAAQLPVLKLTREDLLQAPNHSLYRLGHSTVLLKLRDRFWLTDPVFANRAFPVQWIGPKRFHEAPITIDELPPIEGVLISHDHYDHLDRSSILALASKTKNFLAPLGVGDLLIEWGVDPGKVHQLDWWGEIEVDGLKFVATPARHFSGRGLNDANSRLWTSWVILDKDIRLFFGGDSGYFSGFREIGERYGPFDLTLLECGAYDTRWPDVHMQPAEVLRAHQDLRGRWLIPIHNGTFDLGLHPWKDPFERLNALAIANRTQISWPSIGQWISLSNPTGTTEWWRELD